MLALAPESFEARRVEQRGANSLSLVRFDRNDYSVPTARWAHGVLPVIVSRRPACRPRCHRVRLQHRERERTALPPGPGTLRWAMHEAAMSAEKKASPDHEYFCVFRERLGAQRAALAVARKLARCHDTLREIGDDVFPEAA
jgi:hypothetical protein